MVTKYMLPVLAVCGIALAVMTVRAQSREVKPAPPVAQPAPAPYEANVPGAGLVEASTENIAIGTHVPGVVTKVFVKAGDKVKAGDALFSLDDRQMRAELGLREAAVLTAQAELDRLKQRPRPEEIPPMEARLAAAERARDDSRAMLDFYESIPDKRAVTAEEMSRRRFALMTSEARVQEARAELDLLKAGTWRPDVAVAEANLASARAGVDQIKTELDRLTVKAPVAGEILKVNVRAGEYAQAGMLSEPLMTLGETELLHIRVDIDENDAWRVQAGSPGVAYVRGNSRLKTEIRFVRFEPYVIPKRSLTGSSGERVDTRVLQVIYAFDRKSLPVFVGQQMDVFIKAPPIGDAKFGVDPAQADQDLQGVKQ